jgi:hypothetical protein
MVGKRSKCPIKKKDKAVVRGMTPTVGRICQVLTVSHKARIDVGSNGSGDGSETTLPSSRSDARNRQDMQKTYRFAEKVSGYFTVDLL